MAKIKKIPVSWTKKFHKLMEKYGVDKDVLDLYALVDRTLTLKENETQILEHLKAISSKTVEVRAEELTKKDLAEERQQYYKLEEEKLEKEFDSNIQKIKEQGHSEKIDEYFYMMREYIRIIASRDNGNLNGLIIEGETGLGKSLSVIQTLSRMELNFGQDFTVLCSYSTPLELYHYLYENNGRIIVLDDMLRLFDNDTSKGLLLAGLWNPTGKRIINYHSTSDKLDAPKEFEFTGKIIILCNRFPKELDTLKSRCLFYRTELDYGQRMECIYEICKVENIPLEIADFIRENTNEATENMNLRLPVKLYEIYRCHPDNWQKLAKGQLVDDEILATLREILKRDGLSKRQRREVFVDETGLSRATYYRYVRKLEKNGFTKS